MSVLITELSKNLNFLHKSYKLLCAVLVLYSTNSLKNIMHSTEQRHFFPSFFKTKDSGYVQDDNLHTQRQPTYDKQHIC